MRTGHSAQYDKPALIVEDGDDLTVQQIMDRCREIGAVYYEDGPEDECFVVTLRPNVGPELWTPRALTRSIVGRKLKEPEEGPRIMEVGPFKLRFNSGFPFFYEQVATARPEGDHPEVRIGRHMANQCLYAFADGKPTLVLPLAPIYEALAQQILSLDLDKKKD